MNILFRFFSVISLAVLINTALPVHAFQPDSIIRIQPLPNRIIPVFSADGTAHRTQLKKDVSNSGYYFSCGAQLPVADIWLFRKQIQMSFAGSIYSSLQRYSNRGETINADYYVDLFFDIPFYKNLFIRWGAGHTSQHLTDDAINLQQLTPINYIKDYTNWYLVYKNTSKRLTAYGGLQWYHGFKIATANTFVNHINYVMLQTGFVYDVFKIGKSSFVFTASDIKFRQELSWRNTFNFQTGIRVINHQLRTMSIAYHLTSGMEERGQFYNKTKDLQSVGLYFDF
ncbi:MAG: hypothetical protein MUC81_06675 [Bacteroidia bacterium]|jgi:hypothetical protein|nr:hypothetical protein [Bacteroidia bacterium]